MKTIVTGGAGFIGSHLVKRLMDEGREVAVVDDFSRGRLENLADLGVRLPGKPGPVDLTDYSQTLKALKGADVVFHMAARVGSLEYLHGSDWNELTALQLNVTIDTNVFRACLEHKVKKIVYASSVSVYPMDTQHAYGLVLSESDMSRINPEGGYGWAKLLGEIQLQWMRNASIGIARIFNVYGEGEAPDKNAHVVPALARKAVLYPSEEFRVFGDGKQTRDFLYVSDAVDALLKLEAKATWPPVIVNIGSGEVVTIKQLVDTVVKVSGKKITPVYDPAKPVGPLSRTADITRTKSVLGWQPKVSLEDGLARMMKWVGR
ncbi:MAG: NAD-dependent epimerase/dehydratase family protein, partial [Dehalococcoidia bacterium]|nr:NAD-dependent epimerase/dehydratase family protein [Dehalococcoidia bacterium]